MTNRLTGPLTPASPESPGLRDMAGLTEAAPVAIVSLDPDGAPQSWNPAAEQLFGLSADIALGHALPGIAGESHSAYGDILAAVRTGRNTTGNCLFGRHAGGALLELRISAAPMLDDQGGLRAILLVVLDETERNRFERQFLHAQKMEAIGQLTGGIAHDFNNLLGILMGSLEMVRDGVLKDRKLLDLVDSAIEAGQKGADLNKRLLAFSRRQALTPQSVLVNEAIVGMVSLLRRSLGERVTIAFQPDADLWPVKVDPVQLETAVVNLCVNARDAMPSGGKIEIVTANMAIGPRVTVASDMEPGDYIVITIADSGTGMTQEVLARVFDPFFTTKPVGKGTGLGLSMVYGFIKQSGGHVAIQSQPGQGTTVRLYLPRSVEARQDAASAPDTVQLTDPAAGRCILLVEDNEGVRRLAIRQLTEFGYQVAQAENAEAALALVDAGLHFDLLFSDVVMPGTMDGIELADRLRARFPALPILLCSGFTERDSVPNGNGRNYPMLDKPYRRAELIEALNKVLGTADKV